MDGYEEKDLRRAAGLVSEYMGGMDGSVRRRAYVALVVHGQSGTASY
jgi:hypothetical protein